MEPLNPVDPPLPLEATRARAGLGWLGRTRRALAFGLSSRDAIVLSLAGFMVRGGIVLLAAPAAVLPSVLGLAGAIGVNAFAIDGRPTLSFIELVVVIAILAAAWLLLAVMVGSLLDVWLIEASLEPADPPSTGSPSTGSPSTGPAPAGSRALPDLEHLLGLAAIRAVCLVPLAITLAWAGSRIYASAYNELTTPSNLGVPLAVRTVLGAADAVAAVLIVWLITETIGGVAVRRFVLRGDGAWGSLTGAVGQLVRRPVTSAATVLLAYGASAVVMAAGIALIATTFDWCLVAARIQQPIAVTLGIGAATTTRDFRPVVFLLAALALGIAWVVASALAGISSAWRSATLSYEVADATAYTASKRSES